ncbi:MAG: SEC-C domain-containing protein [Planctomycetota bacterium]
MSVLDLQQLLSSLLARLRAAIDSDADLAADRDTALSEFFGIREPDATSLGRFYEWYLFERRSPLTGEAPPFVVLLDRVESTLPFETRDLLDELGASRFSIYEYSSGEEELTIHDLISDAMYPIEDYQFLELKESLDDTSLVIGRLYPTGKGSYLFGPFGFVVKGEVATALRRDVANTSGRHGRLSQREMEWLLFGGPADPRPADAELTKAKIPTLPIPPDEFEPLERLEAEVESWLRTAAVEGLDFDEVKGRLEAAESSAEEVILILNEIAFETDVDLETGRRILPAYALALRNAKKKREGANAMNPRIVKDELRAKSDELCNCGSGEVYGNCCLPKDAIARFDAGRANGEQLNDLFQHLAAAMGVEDDDEDDDSPSVEISQLPPIAPMVEEYLWESSQSGKTNDPADAALLEAFARSIDEGPGAPGDAAGVRPEHLQRFFAKDRYCQLNAPGAGAISLDAAALRQFAIWLRDEHGIDWISSLQQINEESLADADRLAAANELLAEPNVELWNRAFVIVGIHAGDINYEVTVEPVDESKVRGRLELAAKFGTHLRAGDCLLFESEPASKEGSSLSARLLRVLPKGARPYLHRNR